MKRIQTSGRHRNAKQGTFSITSFNVRQNFLFGFLSPYPVCNVMRQKSSLCLKYKIDTFRGFFFFIFSILWSRGSQLQKQKVSNFIGSAVNSAKPLANFS